MTLKFTITNLEEVPEDLPPGTYCCRVESATWSEIRVRFVLSPQHRSGDCLFQLVKHEEANDARTG